MGSLAESERQRIMAELPRGSALARSRARGSEES
jgi:hypothetical protein